MFRISLTLVESASQIKEKIKQCIEQEIVPNGLLEDVETFIPSYRIDEPMNEPAVWLFEHPTTEAENKKGKLSSKIYLTTTYEFVCIVYDDDIEKAENMGKDLATRVGSAIMKNAIRNNVGERLINNVKFKALYPTGELQIEGKTNQTPATSIVFDVEYIVDWLKCYKR